MADLTDRPFCRVVRKKAAKEVVLFREMLSAEAIVRGNQKTLSRCEAEKEEKPFVQQIFGADPKTVAKAAEIVMEKFCPDGLDINMGCPVPKIAARGHAGADLMRDPARAAEIVREVKKAAPKTVLTVKTRLGWSDKNDILEFGPMLENAGVDGLIVHGRTKTQGYSGKADWGVIGKLKEKIKIPIIANGDIVDWQSARECFSASFADGIMIGRAALGNPWIFNDIIGGLQGKKKEEIGLGEVIQTVLEHATWQLEVYGKEKGLNSFRKHLLLYFKPERLIGKIKNPRQWRMELTKVESLEDLKNCLLLN